MDSGDNWIDASLECVLSNGICFQESSCCEIEGKMALKDQRPN